jgi:hypothetical protein
MKDEEDIDWKEGFPQLPLDKENKFKEKSWKVWAKEFLFCVFSLKKEENECVRKKTSCYVWRSVIHGSKGVQTKEHGMKLCVISSHNGVHGMISMNKPLDSLLKKLFLLDPLLDLFQTSNNFSLCVEFSFQISASLELLQGNYTC